MQQIRDDKTARLIGIEEGGCISVDVYHNGKGKMYLTYKCLNCGHIYTERFKLKITKCVSCNPERVAEIERKRQSLALIRGRSRKKTNTHHKEHNSWSAMVRRCTDPTHEKYHRYGGRGITVCERWLDFANFLEDMGERPEGMSIDRINNDGNYEPSNCKWSTQREQTQNTRRNVNITINGETYCLSEWSRRLGVSPKIIKTRLKNGVSFDDLLASQNG